MANNVPFDIYQDALNFDSKDEQSKHEEGNDFSLYDGLAGEGGEDRYSDNNHGERSPSPHRPSTPRGEHDEGGSDQTTIYIGNLTWWTTDQDLENLFGEFGKLKGIKFFEDKVNGKSKGYALIEFLHPESAYQAKEKLQGREIHGKACVINFVNPENLKQLNRAASGSSSRPSRGGGEKKSERGGKESFRGGRGSYDRPRGPPGGYPPMDLMGRPPYFRGRGMPLPDPRMLGMPMAHVNPAFLPKESDPRARDEYYRERDREEREREERYRKREREDRDRHKERSRSRERDRDDRKRHRSRSRERDRKH